MKVLWIFMTYLFSVGLQIIIDIQRNAFKENFTNKNVQKGCSKASKVAIFDQKSHLKNTCKIETNGARDIKWG